MVDITYFVHRSSSLDSIFTEGVKHYSNWFTPSFRNSIQCNAILSFILRANLLYFPSAQLLQKCATQVWIQRGKKHAIQCEVKFLEFIVITHADDAQSEIAAKKCHVQSI